MKNKYGQTALILILLSAAALIFLAITFNWGRIAQTKALLTVAADETASLLASDAASYGEAQKQTNLNDTNQVKGPTGTFLDLLLIIIAVIVAIFTFGMGTPFLSFVAIASVALATVNLVLQLVVVQPGITSMWNSLQKSQPIQQQFYEQGIATALQNSVGDQVTVTDYLDWNGNGSFGLDISGQPNDNVSRFAIFYTDRLKMLNQKPIPAVEYFYTQLSELMNGETCDQNANDNSLFGTPILPICSSLGCLSDPINPSCEMKIPNGFQLNDPCTGYDPNNPSTYTPYCDPCCQPLIAPGGKSLRPTSCFPYTTGYSSSCFASPNQTGICTLTGTCISNPNDPSCVPPQCATNNPYGAAYPYLYDPSFQQYNNGISIMDQFGRDQQMSPFSSTLSPEVLSPNGVTPALEFPNGIYTLFWLMKDYSPQVDNIDPTAGLQTSQDHWCTSNIAPGYTPPAGFADLAQLSLSYPCTGVDCCVNNILNVAGGLPSITSAPIQITLTPGPVVNITSPANGSYFPVGAAVTAIATASEPGGTIQNITIESISGRVIAQCSSSPCSYTSPGAPTPFVLTINAIATDATGATAISGQVTINIIDAPTVSVAAGTIAAGTNTTITASASTTAPSDSIVSVTFYDNGTLLGTSTASPYTYSWTVPVSGTSYSITAVATDKHGLTTTSSAITGTVP